AATVRRAVEPRQSARHHHARRRALAGDARVRNAAGQVDDRGGQVHPRGGGRNADHVRVRAVVADAEFVERAGRENALQRPHGVRGTRFDIEHASRHAFRLKVRSAVGEYSEGRVPVRVQVMIQAGTERVLADSLNTLELVDVKV